MPTKSAALTLGRCMPASTIVRSRVELGAEGAVALLDAGRWCRRRRCRPGPRRAAARPSSSGSHSRARLLDRHVELPAELADVGDPRGQHRSATPDLDLAGRCRSRSPRRETSSSVSEARMSRARGPQRPMVVTLVGQVGQRRRRRPGQVVGEPLAVDHAVRAAGDHPEVVVAQPHHGEVGAEAALGVEHRGVDDLADRRRRTGRRRCAAPTSSAPGPVDVEDRERRQVDDRRRVSRICEVLGVDDRATTSGRPTRARAASRRRRTSRAGRRWTRTRTGAPSRRSRRTPRRAPAAESYIGREPLRRGRTRTARRGGRCRRSC